MGRMGRKEKVYCGDLIMIGIQFETYLRKEIFADNQDYADIVIDEYENNPNQRHYIWYVLDDYMKGNSSRYTAYRRLMTWVVIPKIKTDKKIEKKFGYLEDEFKEKMK